MNSRHVDIVALSFKLYQRRIPYPTTTNLDRNGVSLCTTETPTDMTWRARCSQKHAMKTCVLIFPADCPVPPVLRKDRVDRRRHLTSRVQIRSNLGSNIVEGTFAKFEPSDRFASTLYQVARPNGVREQDVQRDVTNACITSPRHLARFGSRDAETRPSN